MTSLQTLSITARRTRDLHREVFRHVKALLKGEDLKEVAERANCSVSTLNNWTMDRTEAPRLDTLCAVLKALGYELRIVSL